MSERCEPPEHLRGVDGWHWVDRHGLGDKELIPWRQNPANGDFEWWYDRGGARFISGQSQTASYWNYIAPVTPPAEVDALRAALLVYVHEQCEGFCKDDDRWNGDCAGCVARHALRGAP